jgi:hypothetical protein
MFLSREPFMDGYMLNRPTRAASSPNVSFRLGGRISQYYFLVSSQHPCRQIANYQDGEKRVFFACQRLIASGNRKWHWIRGSRIYSVRTSTICVKAVTVKNTQRSPASHANGATNWSTNNGVKYTQEVQNGRFTSS